MPKKTLLIFALLGLIGSKISVAGNFYIHPGLLLQSITAETGNFRGLGPKLSAGYGTVLGQGFYIGGELGVSGGMLEISNNSFAADVKSNRTFDLAILPGIMVSSNSMAYLRTGVANSNFPSIGETSTGYQLGVGMQMALLNAWHIRGEYYFSGYDTIGKNSYRDTNPNADNYVFGVVYSFR